MQPDPDLEEDAQRRDQDGEKDAQDVHAVLRVGIRRPDNAAGRNRFDRRYQPNWKVAPVWPPCWPLVCVA